MGETEQEQAGTFDDQLADAEPTPEPDLEPEPEPDPDTPADEAEEPDTSDVTEGAEPEPEPEPEEELYAKPGTAAFDKAEKSLTRKVRNYLDAVETFANQTGQPLIVNESSLEWVPGFIFNPQLIPPDDTQKQFASFLLNEELLPSFRQSPDAQECERCGGYGYLLTGSRVEGKKTIPCRVCKGDGWTGGDKDVAPAAFAPIVTQTNGAEVTFTGAHPCVNCGQVFGSPAELAAHLTAGVCQRPAVPA